MVWSRFSREFGASPWRELERMFAGFASDEPRAFPPVEIWSGDDGILLRAQVPGFSADEIELSVVGDRLTLKGERSTGRFLRTLEMPFGIESEHVRARFQDGMLEVELPRKASEKPRKIDVKGA